MFMSFLYLAISSLDEPLNQANSCALWLRQAPSHSFSWIATWVLQEKLSLTAEIAKLGGCEYGAASGHPSHCEKSLAELEAKEQK